MYKIIVGIAISAAALVGCSQSEVPQPVVTITEQAPAPETNAGSNTSDFINFVRENGGFYASSANDSDIVSIGNSICRGFNSGLSRDEIIDVLADSLIESGMANENGAIFAAALLRGAELYLCGVPA